MKLAVLSGKGGTGKTFVSVNMAYALACNQDRLGSVSYIDCDVEAPNGSLFLKPQDTEFAMDSTHVCVRVPSIDKAACNGCRACTQFCAFGALAFVMDGPLFFEGMCHSCGGCVRVCPTGAITETNRSVGEISRYNIDGLQAYEGRMNIGETSGMPVIEELLRTCTTSDVNIIDCPPGTACAAAACVRAADACIIVAEPSAFGAHNMAMAYDLVKFFNKPCAVILNKVEEGINHSREYCSEHGIDILMEIPFSRQRAQQISRAQIVAQTDLELRFQLQQLIKRVINKEVLA